VSEIKGSRRLATEIKDETGETRMRARKKTENLFSSASLRREEVKKQTKCWRKGTAGGRIQQRGKKQHILQ